MIRDKNFPPIAELLKAFQGEGQVQHGEDGPVDLEATRKVHEMATADPSSIRFICTGCNANAPMLEAAMCDCGGFICAACQRIEEDGVCNHVLPTASDVADSIEDDE